MSEYYTEEKIEDLISNGSWELARDGSGYILRQKDRHHMKTITFYLPEALASKFFPGDSR